MTGPESSKAEEEARPRKQGRPRKKAAQGGSHKAARTARASKVKDEGRLRMRRSQGASRAKGKKQCKGAVEAMAQARQKLKPVRTSQAMKEVRQVNSLLCELNTSCL